jgi:putative intracellular protease/amidase
MLKDHPTGLWLEEAASPYYIFKKAGHEVVLASPKGGPIPIDQQSVSTPFFTDEAKEFLHDGAAIGALSHSVPLADIDFSTVGAIFVAGGHGAPADLVDNAELKQGIETLYAADKVVAAVCHGPVCLAQCTKPDGTPLVAGKTVTAFSNTEETEVQLTSYMPFLLEDKFQEQGGHYEKGMDWTSNVRVDGKLVTGQNPQSSQEAAEEVVKLLSLWNKMVETKDAIVDKITPSS